MLILLPGLFFAIAFVFSMLGMGGSQLYIPILFWAGLDFKTQAIPLGMLLNVVNTTSAAVTYARKHMIHWRLGLSFGLTMMAAAPVGTAVHHLLPSRLLILIFALFTATAGILMWIGWQPKRASSHRAHLVLGLTGGAFLGFTAGLIGRGGGSFVVPLLYMAGVDARTAAATSALAVTFSGSASFISHVATTAHPDWRLWGLCVAAVLAGSQAGSRFMSSRLKGSTVKKVFAAVLIGIAATLIIKDVI